MMNKIHKPTRSNTGLTVRGKPISNPIPFPDDDEFPIRTPGTGIALPLGSESQSQIRVRESVVVQLENGSHQTGIAVSDFIDPNPAPQSIRIPPKVPSDEQSRRSTQPSHLRDSVASKISGSSVAPQRKKSTMRSVLGKLFGRKRKGGSGSSTPAKPGSDQVRAGQHRSDPSALSKSPPASSHQKRSASLPINEFNRAFRSHSVAAKDFPLRASAEKVETKQIIQADGQTRPRRATTPSRLWTPTKTPGYVDWTGLSPRPASTHVRGSFNISDAAADANIGMAVTSSEEKMKMKTNRRSRSVGELRDIAGIGGTLRRRSDEIRYWRQSYDPGVLSPMSSQKAEEQESILIEEDSRDVATDQPQPFMFEMASMKITEAASLETRVQRLEKRLLRMEQMSIGRGFQPCPSDEQMRFHDSPRRKSTTKRSSSITRPQNENSDISLPRHHYRDAPPPRSQPQDLQSQVLPNSQRRESSYNSGSPRPSTISTHNSYHPSFDTYPSSDTTVQPISQHPPTNYARPLSTSTTIRGNPSSSSPTYATKDMLTSEHYSALANMILVEQHARQDLENVVAGLQRQLHAYLRAHSPNRLASKASYPTPNSETHPDRDLLHHSTKDYNSVYEEDIEERFKHSVPQDIDFDPGEVFQTPMEGTGQFGDEIFGDSARNGYAEDLGPYEDVGELDEKSMGAPRTLSLSQITMGKRMQSVNF